jgi:hypothetical protein
MVERAIEQPVLSMQQQRFLVGEIMLDDAAGAAQTVRNVAQLGMFHACFQNGCAGGRRGLRPTPIVMALQPSHSVSLK